MAFDAYSTEFRLATLFEKRRPVLVVNRGVSFPLDAASSLKYRIRLDAVVTVCDRSPIRRATSRPSSP